MIRKNDGLILKTMKYGDTSRIVTAFTRDFGKISLIAKGARAKKSKFGSALEPLSFSHLVYYHKGERELQLVSQADLIAQFRSIIDDEKKLMTGFAMLEYLNAVTVAEDPHVELFDLIQGALATLNDKMTNGATELVEFLANLADTLGFGLNFFHCTRCGTKLEANSIVKEKVLCEPRNGGFYCSFCEPGGLYRTVFADTLVALQSLQRRETGAPRAEFTQRSFNDALDLLSHHLETHVEGMRRIRTLALVHPFG